MANNFQFLAQSLAPDILGSFERGRAQARQVDRERLADQELEAQIGKRNRFEQLAQGAFSAQPQERDALIAQAAGVNPQGAMQLHGHFAEQQESQRKLAMQRLPAATRALVDAPPQLRPTIYKLSLQDFRAFSPNAPDQWSEDMLPLAQQFLAMAPATAGVQEFNAMTQGLPAEDVERARRIELGLLPRAAGVGSPAGSLQELEALKRMSPQDQELFFRLKTGGTNGVRVPVGFRPAANGSSLEPIPGGPADPARTQTPTNVTEGERKSAALATRLENSLRALTELERTDPGSGQPGVLEKVAGMAGETAANFARSPARQQADAAQADALDAALTLATGAAYTKEQLAGLRKAYFPQLGDDTQTIAAKQRNFETIVQTARIAAGRAEPSVDQALDANRSPPPGRQPQQGPGAPREITATGPNGQRIVLRNGQWMPLQ